MNVLKPHLQTTIWTLLRAGNSQREIERRTGISRHTIRSYAERFAAQGDPPGESNCPGVATGSLTAVATLVDQTAPARPPAPSPASPPTPSLGSGTSTSLCEPHRVFIEAQLRLGRNAMAIYQEMVDEKGFAGRYNSVKRFVSRLRVREPEQFDRLSFAPGEEMQVDYGEGAPTLVPGSDRYRKPRLFVATLRYSRRSFRRVVWKSGQRVWAELHEQAWRYFGGSCRYVVLDNLKEGVLKLEVSRPHVSMLCDQGKLGEVVMTDGGHRRIRASAVEAYLNARTKQLEGVKSPREAAMDADLYDFAEGHFTNVVRGNPDAGKPARAVAKAARKPRS